MKLTLPRTQTVDPRDLCGQTIHLPVDSRLHIAGDTDDRTLEGRLRDGLIRDLILECEEGFVGPALTIDNTERFTLDNVTIRGGSLVLSDAWNANLNNVTLMNAHQRSQELVKQPALLVLSTIERISNDIMCVGCRFEASTGTPVYVKDAAMFQMFGCKIHGTGPSRRHQYHGPLVKLTNCPGWRIDSAFAHGRVDDGDGIVEVDGTRNSTGRLTAVVQPNCEGNLLVNKNTNEQTVVSVEETRARTEGKDDAEDTLPADRDGGDTQPSEES